METEEFSIDDGRIFKSRTFPAMDKNGNYNYGIHLFEDITESKQQEQKIIELNKTLRLISQCNEILVRSVDEIILAKDISKEIVKRQEYNFTGVFFVRENTDIWDYYTFDEKKDFILKKINVTDEHFKNSPVNLCEKENRVICINDIVHDPMWTELLKANINLSPINHYDMQGSVLILPLNNGKSIGAMIIYSKSPDMFNEKKVALFKELSDDMAYGISTIRLRCTLEESNYKNEKMLVQLHENLDGIIRSIAKMSEARDPYTAGHQQRVFPPCPCHR